MRPADNVLMWQWDNLDPFGANVANQNPAGHGPFMYNLRFPGQYYDAETATNYNYFREQPEDWCRYIYKLGDKYYGFDKLDDSSSGSEFEFSK